MNIRRIGRSKIGSGSSFNHEYETAFSTHITHQVANNSRRASNEAPSMSVVQSNVDWQSTKKTIAERNRHMFNNSEFSDISLTCSGKKFYAHKYVLATSSVVFKKMIDGLLSEKNPVLHLSDTDEKSLEEFLRFLYTDECNFTTFNAVSVLYLSKKYALPSLTEKCVDFLVRTLNVENVMITLDNHVPRFNEKKLEEGCWQFIDKHTTAVITSENFKGIKYKTLASLLKRDSLNVDEINLFLAVLQWIDFQCSQQGLKVTAKTRRSVIGEAIYDIRFLAMNNSKFTHVVATSDLLTADELVAIFKGFHGLHLPELKWRISNSRRYNN